MEAATITPELREFRTQFEGNVQAMGSGLSAISDYIGGLTSQWDNAHALNDVLERSIAAQNFAVVRMLPNYADLELPLGSKKVLKSLTKTTAKKLLQSDKIWFDPKEKDFYHLLPNYVASCCKEIGIDGIRYRSTGYNCCVLWKDDYFEYAEGSREVIPE